MLAFPLLLLFCIVLLSYADDSWSVTSPTTEAVADAVAEVEDAANINSKPHLLITTSDVPTFSPTQTPTVRPTAKPSTRKPTRRPTIRKSIYLDYYPDEVLDYSDQQNTVSILIVAIFVFMAFEVAAPEIVMLVALMLVIFCEILTLADGLAGT